MSQALWDLRKFIGTHPEEVDLTDYETPFHRGVEGLYVDLIDFPRNPYKALFTIATATWGDVWATYKWGAVRPEARLYVVNAVLNRKTLPNAMEAATFTFEIAGLSRAAFDQIARARIGAVFGSMGWRDNCHANIGFRIPEAIAADPEKHDIFVRGRLQDKEDYVAMLADQGNWQDARATLPISAIHRFACAFSYMSLQNFMAKRLMFNEQADTVATAWLMRAQVQKQFPLLASYFRPASDWARKCVEHVGDEMAQAFGNLFRCSGRWPCEQAGEQYTFNSSCSDRETIMEQTGLYIPSGGEDMPNSSPYLEELAPTDRALFLEA